jgi:Holliday junction resolvase
MRRASRIDANQDQIVNVLRAYGATVQSLATVGNGCPDLLVGYQGKTLLMEIKDGNKMPSKKKLNDLQTNWHANWRGGALALVDSPESALRMIRTLNENS